MENWSPTWVEGLEYEPLRLTYQATAAPFVDTEQGASWADFHHLGEMVM